MVQQPRRENPLYSCTIPIDPITKNADEELIAFGISEEDAIAQAKQLLEKNYGCDREQIQQLIEQAKIENIAPWCAPNNS